MLTLESGSNSNSIPLPTQQAAMTNKISKKDKIIKGTIVLNGSKSISNRALIIRALSSVDFEIKKLSNAEDTETLDRLLSSNENLLDVKAAGTTFRFLTAYLSLQPDTQVLTGSVRMKQRPVGPLADALQMLGANIQYLEKEGYPPISIGSPNIGQSNQLSIDAGISSQFISALLMIAPNLPNGIELELVGDIVSQPYIDMTLNLMAYFGIQWEQKENTIHIKSQKYQSRDFTVEADWSAASYYYTLAALADEADLQLDGLFDESVQGDSVLAEMMTVFGVETTFNKTGIRLQKKAGVQLPETFSYNFLACPDIAQSLAVTCAGLGVKADFTGLQTLRIKETDRIDALEKELNKVNILFSKSETDAFAFSGKADLDLPEFETYEDHRMAMSLAALALYGPVLVNEPDVVQKSYPLFWEDLKVLGFLVEVD